MTLISHAKQIANCESKRAYRSRGAAMIRAHHHHNYKVYPYRCPICGDWHLTHLEPDEQNKKDRESI